MKCSICDRNLIKNDDFMYMNAAGESSLGKFEIYDCKFLFCPKCASIMYSHMKNMIAKNKVNKNVDMKKTKIIKFENIKKKF